MTLSIFPVSWDHHRTFPELSPYPRQPSCRVSPHFSFPPTAAPRWGEVTQFLTFRVWCTLFCVFKLDPGCSMDGFHFFLRLIYNSQVFPPFGLSEKPVTGWACLPCIPLGIYLPVELLDHRTIVFTFLYTFWASWLGNPLAGGHACTCRGPHFSRVLLSLWYFSFVQVDI